jgi:tripartite-type tricarboxylate transporter receptor subunit TctC
LRDRFAQQGVDAQSSTPEQLNTLITQEVVRWDRVIKAANLKIER